MNQNQFQQIFCMQMRPTCSRSDHLQTHRKFTFPSQVTESPSILVITQFLPRKKILSEHLGSYRIKWILLNKLMPFPSPFWSNTPKNWRISDFWHDVFYELYFLISQWNFAKLKQNTTKHCIVIVILGWTCKNEVKSQWN